MNNAFSRFVMDAIHHEMSNALEEVEQLDRQGYHRNAIARLYEATREGDAAAAAVLGKRLFFGDRAPQAFDDGIRLIQAAARQGDGQALAQIAVFHAMGIFPKSWEKSLEYLVYAAQRNSLSAQAQLIALSEDEQLCGLALTSGISDHDWGRLAESIRLEHLLSPEQPDTLSASPRIMTLRQFLPHRICHWLIELARPGLNRARVYDAQHQSETVSETRTNSSATLDLMKSDVVTLLVQNRIAETVSIPMNHMEAIMVLHYAKDEQITAHYDFIHPRSADFQSQIGKLGQRQITFITYLNEHYSQGETTFPELELSNKGRTGDAIFFVNILDDDQPDLRTLHCGTPPGDGEKWIMTQFIRQKPVLALAPESR